MSYKKMPELNVYRDYKSCVTTHKERFKYCVTHVYIQPNQSSELWRSIEEFSSYTYQHYRHDVLKRGICMNDCSKTVENLQAGQKEKFGRIDFEIKDPYPAKIGKKIPELGWSLEDLELANVCNNLELNQLYGLRSLSRISFCLTQNGNTARKCRSFRKVINSNNVCKTRLFFLVGDTLDHIFVFVICTLVGLVMLATVTNDQCNTSLFQTFLRCFDAKRNFSMLTKPSASFTFTTFKMVGLALIACSHAFSALNLFSMVEPFRIEDSVHRSSAVRIRGWQIFLPILFLISGYFMSFDWIGQLLRGEVVRKRQDAAQALLKRIVRFFPSMAFMVFLFATRFYNYFSEPKWIEVVAHERVNCRENGWTNLLFINNVLNSREGVSVICAIFVGRKKYNNFL